MITRRGVDGDVTTYPMGCDDPWVVASPKGRAIVFAQSTDALALFGPTPTTPFGESDVFFGVLRP